MKKIDVVKQILFPRVEGQPLEVASAFAPSNIALCKYWGKRNEELNLPLTSSLSVSLGDKGATTHIKPINAEHDAIILNKNSLVLTSSFSQRLIAFLNLFRTTQHFEIQIESNIPIAAGLASSACGFASIVLALDKLYQWRLKPEMLSILARLGSGSAARSLWQGFVEWQVGLDNDGLDSHGIYFPYPWSDFCIGLLIFHKQEKKISSRLAMKNTVLTSAFYSVWPEIVKKDLSLLKQAIIEQDFHLLGKTAEANALAMHATMLNSAPPILYSTAETVQAMHQVWQLREQGLPVYFTQDAGPNLKLLFEKKYKEAVKTYFPTLDLVQPFV